MIITKISKNLGLKIINFCVSCMIVLLFYFIFSIYSLCNSTIICYTINNFTMREVLGILGVFVEFVLERVMSMSYKVGLSVFVIHIADTDE